MEQRNTSTIPNPEPIPVAMTVAGSDSGGGAGIQADLRTFTACGVFGTSAITAVTSQNPREVVRVDELPPEAVRSQIETVFKELNIRAVKTGMLFSAPVIAAAAESLAGRKCPLVVDPVMVSTSGMKLLRDDALALLQEKILPLADWITPNIPEAELLSGLRIDSMKAVVRAAEAIAAKWDTCVVVKGGHADGDPEAADVVCTTERTLKLTTPRLATAPLTAHGTGCTFSAALTAALAKGLDDLHALIEAKAFVLGSLAEARAIGRPGPNMLSGMFPPADPSVYQSKILLGKI